MATQYMVKTGPDRWQIDMHTDRGDFKSGWVDLWIVEAIAQTIRQVDNIEKRVRVELVVEEEEW